MRNTEIDLYTITTLTNLHAGRGDSNYGIVDNEVQRDPIENYPAIFASSLKGALRQLFDDNVKGKDDVLNIFGNEVRNDGTIKPGKYIFHEARLVSLPVRSDQVPFLHGTTPEILQGILDNYVGIKGVEVNKLAGFESLVPPALTAGAPKATIKGEVDEYSAVKLNDDELKYTKAFQDNNLLAGGDVALFDTSNFKSICERLPIIARNQLESGVSKNLFYEEVVPRQTRFAFVVERPSGDDKFYDHLQSLNFRVQIGGNASIGYGVCKLDRVVLTKKS